VTPSSLMSESDMGGLVYRSWSDGMRSEPRATLNTGTNDWIEAEVDLRAG